MQRKAEQKGARRGGQQREMGRRQPEGMQGRAGRGASTSFDPSKGLEENSRDALYARARNLGIQGRSKMNKDQLVRAIRRAQ